MALIGANELKRKMVISVDNHPYTVVEVLFRFTVGARSVDHGPHKTASHIDRCNPGKEF